MTTPLVIEIPRTPEPVTRDSFIDDLTAHPAPRQVLPTSSSALSGTTPARRTQVCRAAKLSAEESRR